MANSNDILKEERAAIDGAIYRKKKPQVSKSSRKANHKHQYERVIVYDGATKALWWSSECAVCGETGSVKWSELTTGLLKDGVKESWRARSEDYLSIDEARQKFPKTKFYLLERTTAKFEYTLSLMQTGVDEVMASVIYQEEGTL